MLTLHRNMYAPILKWHLTIQIYVLLSSFLVNNILSATVLVKIFFQTIPKLFPGFYQGLDLLIARVPKALMHPQKVLSLSTKILCTKGCQRQNNVSVKPTLTLNNGIWLQGC